MTHICHVCDKKPTTNISPNGGVPGPVHLWLKKTRIVTFNPAGITLWETLGNEMSKRTNKYYKGKRQK